MAGHSKWANIQHRKGAQDKKRAGMFAKLSKEITVAAKMGGGDPDSNPRLRLAISTARGQSLPKDNIERAIKKGTGEGQDAADFAELRYEGYGPAGVAIIVECLTDNRNRSAAEVRSAFTKYNGNMGETGSVSFGFENVGEIIYDFDVTDADTMFEKALEAGASDVESDESGHYIYTAKEDLHSATTVLSGDYSDPKSAKLIWKATTPVEVGADSAGSLMKLIDVLEELDDVQNVYTSADFTDEALASLDG